MSTLLDMASSARNDDKPLSKEEQEEEVLRSELTEAGLYEENMSTQEMKEMMKVVNASKATSLHIEAPRVPTSKFDSQQSNSQESQKSPLRPLPTFGGNNRLSTVSLTTQSPEDELNNKEESQDDILHKSFENSSNNEKNSFNRELDIDRSFVYNKDDYPALGQRNTFHSETRIKDSGNASNSKANLTDERRTPVREPKLTPSEQRKLNLENWRPNPSLSFEEKVQQMLEEKELLHSHEYGSLSRNEEDVDSDEFEQLCRMMSEKLDNYRKTFISEESANNTKWGSPIKVGTSKQVPPYN